VAIPKQNKKIWFVDSEHLVSFLTLTLCNDDSDGANKEGDISYCCRLDCGPPQKDTF
jgi:hypothetical protein